jgi:CubicO group peptidase (beta-lactamase class C family)
MILKTIFAGAALLLSAQAPTVPVVPPLPVVPGENWSRTTAQAAGWSPDLLAEANAYAERIGTASLLVVQHGQIVDSLGDISRPLEVHSVRKSLLSALIGIAAAEHRIDLNATLAQLGIDDVPPSLTPEEKQATVRDLLASRSGVYHVALYETEGERRNRPPRGSHPPGTFWYYNNWDFNALGAIYEHAEGQSIFTAFMNRIARPIGMQDYRPSAGRYVTGPESSIPAYPFRMSARDLARFGLLYLHGGRWGDRQIVPAAWVTDSTTPRSVTTIDSGYAYLWWTGWEGRGVPVMGLPPGAFWADGAEGQFVVVDPIDDFVVVHQTAATPVPRRKFGHIMWLIRRAAHAADPGPDPELR